MILNAYFISLVLLLVFCIFLPKGKFIILNTRELTLETNKLFHWTPRLLFILFLIGLFAALRDVRLGTDYAGYVDFYEYILEHGEFMPGPLIGVEPGWNYLNLWLAKLGVPHSIFFGCVTVITWYFFIKGSYEYQFLLPLMFFFVISTGFFFWTISGLRQSIAIMVFFYSIRFIKEHKIKNYVLTLLLASFFHVSIVLLLPFYFIKNLKYNRNISLLLFLVSLGFVGTNLFIIVGEQLLKIFGHLEYLNFYTHYLENSEKTKIVETSGTNLGFLIKSIFTFYILYQGEKTLHCKPELNTYFLLFSLYSILNNLFFSIELVARLLNYFYICFPIVAGAVIYYSRTKLEKLICLSFIFIFFLLYLVTTYRFLLNSLS